jgi:hypothetical protein
MVARPTLQQVQGLPDPALSWMWTADILFNNIIIVSALQVLEVNFPFAYIESISRPRAGSFLYFPGHSNIDGTSVSFYETENFYILQAFKTWQGNIKDDKGNYGLPINYLGEIVLRCYDGTGRPGAETGTPRFETTLIGCWPAKLSDWSLNYQGSNHLIVQVQFSVNDSDSKFFDPNGIEISSSITSNVQLSSFGNNQPIL